LQSISKLVSGVKRGESKAARRWPAQNRDTLARRQSADSMYDSEGRNGLVTMADLEWGDE
jgi:hypothetical protein